MPPPRRITQPCRIICEGYADSAFFNALIKKRAIPNLEAECARTEKEQDRCGGKHAIADTLRSLVGYSQLQPKKLRGVIVAVDVDDDAGKTLRDTLDYIKSVQPHISYPGKFLEISKGTKDADFSLAVLGIPWHDQLGNLDTLLFESLQVSHADIMGPLGTFCDLTQKRREGWTLGPNSKMKLRCTIAVTYKPDPGQSLGILLGRTDIPLFNLADATFNQIAKFLHDFQHQVLAA
jgi:hypothetical protein